MPEKQKIFKYILIFLALVFAFLAWFSTDRTINLSNLGIAGALIWFSLFFVFFSLGAILIKKVWAVELLAAVSFGLSLFFILNTGNIWQNFLVIFAGLFLTYFGLKGIKKDLKASITIDVWKLIKTKGFFIILSLALLIANQYYWETKEKSLEDTLPKFKTEILSEKLARKIISYVNPDFQNLQNDNLSVDQFILEVSKSQLEDGGQATIENQLDAFLDNGNNQNISVQERKALEKELTQKLSENQESIDSVNQALVLEEGRRQLSEMVGRKVGGEEKIADIFSEIISRKINEIATPTFSTGKNLVLFHLILSLVLFLTLVSFGLFLNIFLSPLAGLLFFILKKMDLVRIIKVQKEVEEIE